MIVVSLIIPLAIIALVVLLIVSIKVGNDKKGEEEYIMKTIYVYLVLFATLMMMIGGSVAAFMSLADIISPAPYYQSFEEYRQWGIDYDDKNREKISEEQLRANYEEMIKNDQEQALRRSINTLIKSFGWIIIPLPIFVYFQRQLGKKE